MNEFNKMNLTPLFVIMTLICAWLVIGQYNQAKAQQHQYKLISEMSSVCHHSYKNINGPLEQRCGELIDKVQQDPHFEVMSNNGYYWAEATEY